MPKALHINTLLDIFYRNRKGTLLIATYIDDLIWLYRWLLSIVYLKWDLVKRVLDCRTVVLNQGQFCPQGDIWQYLEIFDCYKYQVCVARGSGCNTTGIYYIKARDASKYPKMHRTPLTTKNNLVRNVSNTKVKKPFCSITRGGLGSLPFKL